MNPALLYVRVSSKDQEDGYSLDAQEKLGFEYTSRKNLSIVKSWKVSESAWRSERTAFNQMIEYAKRHDEIKDIIFDVTDRMTRNDFDKLKIYTLIKESGKTIHFSRTGKVFDRNSGSDDEFMLDIEVAVAKKMSNDISRKTRMGMLEKAEQGLYPSVAPLGYRNNLLTHLIEVDEDRAHFVRKAFSMIASGSYSLAAVSKKLYEEGLRSKKGNRVGKSSIENVLKNPVYYRAFRWQGQIRDGRHYDRETLVRYYQTYLLRANKMFLLNMEALRQMKAAPFVIKIDQAGQVNVGEKQLNVSERPSSKAEDNMRTREEKEIGGSPALPAGGEQP